MKFGWLPNETLVQGKRETRTHAPPLPLSFDSVLALLSNAHSHTADVPDTLTIGGRGPLRIKNAPLRISRRGWGPVRIKPSERVS